MRVAAALASLAPVDALWFFGGLFGVMVLAVATQIVVMRRAFDRQAARWLDEPQIGAAYPRDGERFELRVPASGACDVVMRLGARDRASGRRSYSMARFSVTLLGERPPRAGTAEPATSVALEVLVGSPAPRQGGLPLVRAVVEDAVAFGAMAARSFRLARIPAGGAFVLEGRLAASVDARSDAVSIVVRPCEHAG